MLLELLDVVVTTVLLITSVLFVKSAAVVDEGNTLVDDIGVEVATTVLILLVVAP